MRRRLPRRRRDRGAVAMPIQIGENFHGGHEIELALPLKD
jgi:hypothetical protein